MIREDGTIAYDHNGISDNIVSYFQNLFQVENNYNDFRPIINKISVCVSSYDNESLLAPFIIDEFKIVLFQMDYDKSPGSDGLNPTFLKKNLHLCVLELFQSIVIWLETRNLPP